MLKLRSSCISTIIQGTTVVTLDRLRYEGSCPTVEIIWQATVSEFGSAVKIVKEESAPGLLIDMLQEDQKSILSNEAEVRYLIKKTIDEVFEKWKIQEKFLLEKEMEKVVQAKKKIENFPNN